MLMRPESLPLLVAQSVEWEAIARLREHMSSVSRDDFLIYRKHLRLVERTYPRMEGDYVSVGIPQFSLTYLHQQASMCCPTKHAAAFTTEKRAVKQTSDIARIAPACSKCDNVRIWQQPIQL